MIFKNVSTLSNKIEKAFFVEQVKVYIRLIEVFCEKNNIAFQADEDVYDLDELKSIGVVNSEDDIDNLKKILGRDYQLFIKAVNFAVLHKNELNGLLDKLSNTERQKVQRQAAEKHELTLVDFFCGAGGLSLGFLQQGFNVKLANDIEDVCIQTYKYNHPELPTDKLIQGI